jgi:hypothetical protein
MPASTPNPGFDWEEVVQYCICKNSEMHVHDDVGQDTLAICDDSGQEEPVTGQQASCVSHRLQPMEKFHRYLAAR